MASANAQVSNQPIVIGLRPSLPKLLSRTQWWSTPVAAERLAALRIALAVCLLLDMWQTYWPDFETWFTSAGLGGPKLFDYLCKEPNWRWSLFRGVDNPDVLWTGFYIWIASTVALLFGFQTRLAAISTWILSVSFANVNSYIDNSGDQVRTIILLYLMLSPCGAVWSIDSWLKTPRSDWQKPHLVYPWAVRLIFLQLILIYFCNGVYKLFGIDWWRGESLYYVLGDLTLVRLPFHQWPLPFWLSKVMTWLVLFWEVSFPVLVWHRCTRWLALVIGVGFHCGILITMEIGWFAPYMLCLYLPLIPWERWLSQRTPSLTLPVA